jgi:hypothetical protein
MIAGRIAASAIVALVVASPALAQGRGQTKKNAPPSRTDLAAPAIVTSAGGDTPFAWIDDASTLDAGSVWIAASASSWHGGGASEIGLPILDAAIGLAPRLQLSASVPTSIGTGDPAGAAGGIGTAYVSAKIRVVDRGAYGVKVAVSPTLELLSRAVLDALGPAQRRAHWGAPVSVEIDRGRLRAYSGVGYFSRGVWFSGAGASVRASQKIFVSATMSRSWRRDASGLVPIGERRRLDIGSGVAVALRPHITTFASIGRTIATLPENGAGTSVSAGISLLLAARPMRPGLGSR